MAEEIEVNETTSEKPKKPWYLRWGIWLGLLIFDLLVSGIVVGLIESVVN